jgi:hypothetical protein
VSDRRCSGVKPNGEPCGAVIVQSNGWCPAHDPSREEARKRAAARANEAGRDPELREIRDGLARLMEKADRADADLERVDALVRIARARVYAIKADSEIARHAAEIRELEDAYDRLLDDFEALRDGRDVPATTGDGDPPPGWYLRKRREEVD